MSEIAKRDAAMAIVADGRDNQYELICNTVEWWLRYDVPRYKEFYSGLAFKEAKRINPEISPAEKRVMGPVMKKMEKLGLIRLVDMSATKTRSHAGLANKWVKTQDIIKARA